VLKEAKMLKERYGIGGIWLFDDEFSMSLRDFRIFNGLKEQGLIYRLFTRSEFVSERVVKKLCETGCREILIGVESGSDEIKRIIRKGTTVEMDEKAFKLLKQNGIRVKATFIVLLPGESSETLQETWRFCERNEEFIDDFDFSILAPYPGSFLYEQKEDFDIEFDKYSFIPFKTKPGEYTSVVSTSHLTTEEGIRWRERLEKRFKPKRRLR